MRNYNRRLKSAASIDERLDVDAIDQNPSREGFEESREQVNERRFTAATLTHNRYAFAGRDLKAEVFENRQPRSITKSHVLKFNGPSQRAIYRVCALPIYF